MPAWCTTYSILPCIHIHRHRHTIVTWTNHRDIDAHTQYHNLTPHTTHPFSLNLCLCTHAATDRERERRGKRRETSRERARDRERTRARARARERERERKRERKRETKTESDPLRFRPDTEVSNQRAVTLLFNADIDKSVLAEDALCIQICC